MAELARAIGKMLGAFGASTSGLGERVVSYLEAISEEGLCEACAAAAARTLTRRLKRRPLPADLLEETRETMRTGLHQQHVQPRRALGPADAQRWWSTQAPDIVRAAWPSLSEFEVQIVCRELERQAAEGIVDPSEDGPFGVWATLGQPGDTQRRWWERFVSMRAGKADVC